MANGSFGSNENRRIVTEPESRQRRRRRKTRRRSFFSTLRYDAGRIAPEHWVDIVCCSLLIIFGIIIACNWSAFIDGLFYKVLFPVIYVGSRIFVIVLIIAIIAGLVALSFRRRRYW